MESTLGHLQSQPDYEVDRKLLPKGFGASACELEQCVPGCLAPSANPDSLKRN